MRRHARFARASSWVAPFAVALVLGSAQARAQNADQASGVRGQGGVETTAPSQAAWTAPSPGLHHAAPSVARAGEPLRLAAAIDYPSLVRRAWVVYRTAHDKAPRSADLPRASEGPYMAIVPPEAVQAPWVEYCIEVETVDGRRGAAFASRDAMHRVQVADDIADLRERSLSRRLDDRRSAVTTFGEYVLFGRTDAMVRDPAGRLAATSIRDQYYRIEAGYTYRPLGTIAEFSLRGGVVRGTSVVPGEVDESKMHVGLNYGAPTVRLRLDDAWHVEAELLTSVTEVGFSTGVGGAVLIGDPYGTRLTLGFESIQRFGSRVYSRMDIAANRQILVAPIVEVTDMPHASQFGVRLLAEVRYELGQGFHVGARGGYQARMSVSGGPAAGAMLGYSF
jgi:hypothetical protein